MTIEMPREIEYKTNCFYNPRIVRPWEREQLEVEWVHEIPKFMPNWGPRFVQEATESRMTIGLPKTGKQLRETVGVTGEVRSIIRSEE